jgi:NADH:ubiquinone reductase (H+-translocating)
MRRILVVGGGFAGLWAAAGAARALDRAGAASDAIEVALVNPDPFHVIRVRCYEDAGVDEIRVPLAQVLGPIGVRRVEGMAVAVDPTRRTVAVRDAGGTVVELGWDRLVLAAGSALWRPAVPGLAEHALDVDTTAGAERLRRHLAGLAARPASDASGRWTAAVIGAGLVGLEVACELPARLRSARAAAGLPDDQAAPLRVLLLDHGEAVGAGMGEAAAPAIRAGLAAAGVEGRGGAVVEAVDAEGVTLAGGERLAAMTILCATGMRASPLAASLPAALPRDRLGRLRVDASLRVPGLDGVYAAGDIACAAADGAGHETVMSCQHARPMGRIAGHNAACDLTGREAGRIAFAAPDYVTILDLGPWGAVYTAGWDRARLVASGEEAKAVKRRINTERIVPPRNGDRRAILDAAAPIIQVAPATPGR